MICRLNRLPDLHQTDAFVGQYLMDWIKNLITTYNFDGIRIDTIRYVQKSFWKQFVASAGVFQMGDCNHGDEHYIADYQNYVTGVFNYPMKSTIRDVWIYGKSMKNIANRWASNNDNFKDVDALGIFVDNH